MGIFKKLFVAVLLVGMGVLSFQLVNSNTQAFSSGSPGARTGSPGDNSNTCRNCHSGSTPTEIPNAITSNIPVSGYVPGEIYNVSASISESGRNMFGFELTAESDNNNSKVGEWIITNSSQNRLVNGNKSVTHRNTGRSGQGTKTWEMQWKAPEVNVGAITFYASLMAANGTGSNSGDNVYVAQKKVQPTTTRVAKKKKLDLDLTVYPNPTTSRLNLDFPNGFNESYGVYIIDAGGVVRAFYEKENPRGGKLNLNVSDLAAGRYFVRIFSNNYTAAKPFIKQ